MSKSNQDESRAIIGVLDMSDPVLKTESYTEKEWTSKPVGTVKGLYVLENIIRTPEGVKEVWIKQDYVDTD